MTDDAQNGRRLRIAMLAPPWIPIPPPAYGGIESVIAMLADALVTRGHDVELFCAPGSKSSATVRTLLPDAHPDAIERAVFEVDHVSRAFTEIEGAADIGTAFDVLHDHCGFTTLAMADRIATPVVHTVHGPFEAEASAFYARHGKKAMIVCLSEAQAREAPDDVHVDAIVPNPIDLDAWPEPERGERDYLLWIGRMNPVKGPQRAIAVAREVGLPLVLAGPVQHGYEEFFEREVAPHIDDEQIRYVGEVGGVDKLRVYAGARALLMPIRWTEPFGMVMIEALASGTPVLAFPRGAATEIVADGETGFLVEDEREMAAKVDAAARLDPQRCRAAVAQRWTPDRVAARYERVYLDALRTARSEVGWRAP